MPVIPNQQPFLPYTTSGGPTWRRPSWGEVNKQPFAGLRHVPGLGFAVGHFAGRAALDSAGTLDAAFNLSNPVVNALELITRERFAPDPEFDLTTTLEASGYMNEYRDNFLGVRSMGEFNYVASKIRMEQARRKQVSSAGLGGLVADVVAGLASPVILLPFVGQARGMQAIAKAATWGFVGSAAEEVVLLANQELRTRGEAAWAITSTVLMAGLLGGIVGRLPRSELEELKADLEVRLGEPMRTDPFVPEVTGRAPDNATIRVHEPPPAPAGTIRVYHGGFKAPSDGGSRWVTSDPEYARTFRAYVDGGAKPVWYVDIPIGSPAEIAMRAVPDEDVAAGITQSHSNHTEIPEEFAAQMKLLTPEDEALLTRGPPSAAADVPSPAPAAAPTLTPRQAVIEDLVKQAVELVRQENRASTSWIQRRMNVGYGKASEVIARLEEMGVISKADSAGRRKVTPVQPVPAAPVKLTEVEQAELSQGLSRERAAATEAYTARPPEQKTPQDFTALTTALKTLPKEVLARFQLLSIKTPKRGTAELELIRFLNEDPPIGQLTPVGAETVPKIQVSYIILSEPGRGVAGSKNVVLQGVGLANRESLAKAFPQAAVMDAEQAAAYMLRSQEAPAPPAPKIDPPAPRAGVDPTPPEPDPPMIDITHPEAMGASAPALTDEISPLDNLLISDRDHELTRMIIDDAVAGVPSGVTAPKLIARARELGIKGMDFISTKAVRRTIRDVRRVHGAPEVKAPTKDLTPFIGGSTPSAAGADIARRSAGGLKMGVRGTENILKGLARMSPVAWTIMQNTSRQGQWLMQQLSNAGLRLEGNKVGIATASGGTAENLIDMSWGMLVRPYRTLDQAYSDYWFGTSVKGFKKFAAGIGRRDGRLSKKEFKEEVGRQLWNEEPHKIAAVNTAAAQFQKDVYDPIIKRLTTSGLMDDVDLENPGVLFRLYDQAALEANGIGFIRTIARHFADQMQSEFQAAFGKFVKKLRAQTWDELWSSKTGLDFLEEWRQFGADEFDLKAGRGNFDRHAVQLAERALNDLKGVGARIQGVNLAYKDPKVASMLNKVPARELDSWLVNDVEEVTTTFLRTTIPDLEIKAKIGDWDPRLPPTEQFLLLVEEQNAKLKQLETRVTEDAAKAGKDVDKVELETAQKKLSDHYSKVTRNLEVVIDRLRHNRGLPRDPASFAVQTGRFIRHWNVVRLMGGTLISSFTDPARPIMKYGLTRTFKDGFVPLITNFKTLRLTDRELKWANAANDVLTHMRASRIFDIGDHLARTSKIGRVMEFAAYKMGLVAAFDYWTVFMRQFSGMIQVGKFSDSLRDVVEGTGTAAQRAESIEFLAAAGIDPSLAQSIWNQMTKVKDGGELHNGTWYPNTEAWQSEEAVRAFRAALVGESNNTIITPGAELPSIMDQGDVARIVFQFKSFGMSSTYKTLAAGLQQRDTNFLQGTLISLALGAFGYYVYGMVAGGQTRERMLKAIDEGDWGKWADEAINRSGVLGILGEAQDILSHIPLLQDVTTLSGEQVTRRGGEGLVDAAFGPSFDLVKNGADVLTGFHDPTQSTAHKLRLMIPLQNHFALRGMLDQIENALPLPERRD